MPGLDIFLPSLGLPPYVCRNCGFWQRSLSKPLDCPICKDFRHILPPGKWSFYDFREANEAFPMDWEEILPGLWHFWNDPVDGIGSHAYLLQREQGNVVFEGATVYSARALGHMTRLGGVRFASASHPHTYGALWQLQDHFDANIALHKDDLIWTNAFRVTHPFDGKLEFSSELRLLHAGVHFAGQAFLVDDERRLIFCGDAMKFDLDEKQPQTASAISSHKSFVRSIPLTPDEIACYRAVFRQYKFDKIYSPFEQVHNVDSNLIDIYLSRLADVYPQTNFTKIDELR
jgi:hypothetical protein